MKKILYTLCLVFVVNAAYSQYYRRNQSDFLLGVNVGYTYPLGDFGDVAKNGIGANLSARYLINEVIGIGFEAGFHSFQQGNMWNKEIHNNKYRLIPILLEATFYIPTWDRTILPYFGVHFGGYLAQIKLSQKKDQYYGDNENLTKNLMRFSPGGGPHVGILFGISDAVKLDLKIKADYVAKIDEKYKFTREGIEQESGNIGFNKMVNISASLGLMYDF